MESIIVFNKTMIQRLEEFKDILGNRDPPLLATSIAAHWSYYLELTIETVGWQALWKIPRRVCEDYDLKFPTVVQVEVKNVNFADLLASVSILSVQDSISIPADHEVILKDLFPTQQQENTSVDAKGTANILDQLRFFYNHLWRPWDCEDCENEDWPSTHLEARLQLYYDMQQGLMSRQTAERISRLLAEGRDICSKIEDLELCIDDEMTDKEDATYALMQLHIQLEPIKTEMRVLENPVMRNIYEKRRDLNKSQKRESEKYVVWNGQCLEKYMQFLKEVEKISGSMTVVKPVHSLQAGLDIGQAGDNFVLAPGTHLIHNSGRLEEGGLILGIDKSLSTLLKRERAGNFLLDVCSGKLSVHDLQVEADNVDMAFVVRSRGTLELTNVVVNGSKKAVGVVVMPGGRLHVKCTELRGCQVGIFCYPGSFVTFATGKIMDCSVGLQMRAYGGMEVELDSCIIANCRNAGIDVIAEVTSSAFGSTEILEKVQGLTCRDLVLTENKIDVVIQQQHDLLEVHPPGCNN